MYQLCQARIEIENTNGMASTYCMRHKGHPDENGKGGHNTINEPPKEKDAGQNNK